MFSKHSWHKSKSNKPSISHATPSVDAPKIGKYKKYIEREAEQEQVIRFLNNKDGGALLIGGDRGSGKTTLIKEAVRLSELQRRNSKNAIMRSISQIRRLTKSPYVLVQIPLIIINEGSTEKNKTELGEKYRSLLMRAMLIGMQNDQLRRYYKWLDLPQRWWRAIGYTQKVFALRSHARYLSKTQTISRSLSGSNNIMSITPSIESAFSAEIDLSDSTLEMKLRDLFEQYSKTHRFIFIFDELDKLPKEIDLENLVLLLKNLFSETGIHAIFVTNEETLKRIMNDSKLIPPTETRTLFSDHVLLNYMSSEEFERYVKYHIHDIPNESLGMLKAALTIETKRSPYALKRFLLRSGSSYHQVISQLKSELGLETFDQLTLLQTVADFVIDKYKPLYNDGYYRRLLVATMDEVSSVIAAANTAKIMFDQSYPSTLLYTRGLFTEEGLTYEQVNDRILQFMETREGFNPKIPTPIKALNDLGKDQRASINSSIGTYVYALNKLGMVNITTAPGTDTLSLRKTGWKELSHKTIEEKLNDKLFEIEEKNLKLLDRVKIIQNAYSKIMGPDIWLGMNLVSDPLDNKLEKNSLYSLANLPVRWTHMRNKNKSALSDMGKKLINTLNSKGSLGLTFVKQANNVTYAKLPNDKGIQIQLLFNNDSTKLLAIESKILIFRDHTASKTLGKTNSKTKNFRMGEDWSNYESCIDEAVKIINAYSTSLR